MLSLLVPTVSLAQCVELERWTWAFDGRTVSRGNRIDLCVCLRTIPLIRAWISDFPVRFYLPLSLNFSPFTRMSHRNNVRGETKKQTNKKTRK